MAYTNEQVNKAKKAKSVEELLAMAKAENVPMTEEGAQKIYDALHKEGELSDDELDNVAGGKGDEDTPAETAPTPAPEPIQVVVGNIDSFNPICPQCGVALYSYYKHPFSDNMGLYDKLECDCCGKEYRHHWDGDKWTVVEG